MAIRTRFAALLVALGACSSPTEIPKEDPAIDGPVISVSAAQSSVHIRPSGDQCGIVFRITNDTRILAQDAAGKVTTSTLSEITAGRHARAWTDDPIAESCPAQGHADVILLL